jgi:NADH-quinone oxidoreductase subunit M
MTGAPSNEVRETVSEISKRELIAITPIIAVIIALGFVPQVALDVINPAVEQIQIQIEVTDLPPALSEVVSLGVNAPGEGVNS